MAETTSRRTVAIAVLVTCGVTAGSMSWAVAAIHETTAGKPVAPTSLKVVAAPVVSKEAAALRQEISAARVALRALVAQRATVYVSRSGAQGVVTVAQSTNGAPSGGPYAPAPSSSTTPAPAPAPAPAPVAVAPAPTLAPVVQATTGASGVVR